MAENKIGKRGELPICEEDGRRTSITYHLQQWKMSQYRTMLEFGHRNLSDFGVDICTRASVLALPKTGTLCLRQ